MDYTTIFPQYYIVIYTTSEYSRFISYNIILYKGFGKERMMMLFLMM